METEEELRLLAQAAIESQKRMDEEFRRDSDGAMKAWVERLAADLVDCALADKEQGGWR